MDATAAFLFSLFVVFATSAPLTAEPLQDKTALQDFIRAIRVIRPLNWDASTPVCNNWVGVACSDDGTRVVGLRLPGVGLNGPIRPNTLSRLTALQILSLRSNNLSGPFPSDLTHLSSLTELHLHSNSLWGPLPSDFSVWRNITAVNLSFNRFNGSIPPSIAVCSKLEILKLSNNLLKGEIPDLPLPNLVVLDLSNNELNGTVPASLRRFPTSSFLGNDLKLVPETSSVPSSPSIPGPSGRQGLYLSEPAVLVMVVGGSSLGLLSLGLLLVMFLFKRKGHVSVLEKERESSSEKTAAGVREEQSEGLVFFDGGSVDFDLEDLLRASAEMLGKGSLGISYKASLEDSSTVVVKRLKRVTVGKREFEQQMELLGSIRHENVASPRAYFFSKDEKLVVYDYCGGGSLFSLLHGEKGGSAGWDTRVRVMTGAARGLAHVHGQSGGNMVHGNVKSANVLLDAGGARMADAGLAGMAREGASTSMGAGRGYRAPELAEGRRATQESDVYSFGVVLLEVLTGKRPGSAECASLVRWVQSVIREEWTGEVFDGELLRCTEREGEMVELLQIAMACVERFPAKRPTMAELVRLIEGLPRAGPSSVL